MYYLMCAGSHCSVPDLSLKQEGSFFPAANRAFSSYGGQDPECSASVDVVLGLSCPLACGIIVSQPGTETSALEGRFLTAVPPGRTHNGFIWTIINPLQKLRG